MLYEEPSLSIIGIARVLSEDLLHPTETSDAKPQVVGSGIVQVTGCIDFPEQSGSVTVQEHDDLTISITVCALAPVSWRFTTTLLEPMCTQEMIEAFAEHVERSLERVILDGFTAQGLR